MAGCISVGSPTMANETGGSPGNTLSIPYPQIIVIQATPETAPTPEPTEAPTIWDKPFNDYTPTEGLLLLTFVALCFLALLIWLR